MEPFQPPPRRVSQPGVDGWGGVSDQPYINVVRLDTGRGHAAPPPQQQLQQHQQQQQHRGQQHRATARVPGAGGRSPQPQRRQHGGSEQGPRSPQQQRRQPTMGQRPPPGYTQPPPVGHTQPPPAGPRVVPNAVFDQSASIKPAVRIVPNGVFEDSRNMQLDQSGRNVRVESTRKSNPIHPQYTGQAQPAARSNPQRQGPTPVVQVNNINPNKAKAKGKNRGKPGQRSPNPVNARPAPMQMRKGAGLTIGARMSTFFGLDDPTGGMYGQELRLGAGAGRHDDDNERVRKTPSLGRPSPEWEGVAVDSPLHVQEKATVPARDLVHGVNEGMAAYTQFIKRERAHMKKIKPRRSMWEGTINPSMSDRTRSLRRGSLTGGTTMKKISEKTMIREELMSLPEFKPVFIRLISLIQFLLMSAMVLYSLLELQFGKFGITNVGEECSVEIGNCPVKFNDDPDLGAVSVELFNPWMGPNTNFLIQFNAKYSPCMREDTAINQKLRQQRQDECGSRVTYANGGDAFNELCVEQFQGHSCCMYYPGQESESNIALTRGEEGLIFTNVSDGLRVAGSRYGMMPLRRCQDIQGALWIQDNTITTGNNANMMCDIPDQDPVNVVLRPCCLGTRGTCTLLTKSQCNFRAGIYHENDQLCSDVACLAETCTTKIEGSLLDGGLLETKPHPYDNEVAEHDQWQRFIAPVFLHSGAIHFFVMVTIQLYIGSPIERSIGFLRIMLIYMISGIGGYLVSGIFDPYVVSVGSNPAVFGLLGVVLVELLQTWKVVPGAIYKLLRIIGVILIAVLVGSLPFVDNHAQMGGLIFGMLSACIFLPYISLGKWHERGRKIILFIAAPLLFILIITTLVTFYAVQNTEWCTWCGDFNCWEWHSTLSCDGDVANV